MTRATKRPTSLKASVYEQIARIGQAASSPSRLELLDLLSQGPRTVEALATQTGQSVATTSHHLQVLRRARLVDAEKAGLYVTYRLADPQVDAFLLDLRHLAESRLAEIQQLTHQFLDARGALEPVDNDELVRRVRGGEVTLIDVRPREEYVAGHIPGAMWIYWQSACWHDTDRDFVTPDAMAQLFGEMGIGPMGSFPFTGTRA